jgi:transcriptional regulator with PAS, ATPase and Fis domain
MYFNSGFSFVPMVQRRNQMIKKLSEVESVLLISGSTGTGKTTIAKKIHNESKRCFRPFIKVNMATMSASLFESELFGHKKGAFTGANENKKGYLDQIDGGTLFLDEIGEVSMEQQKKLLDLVETREYSPVGCVERRTFKGTIIAATNRNLEEMVNKNKFREDLYYRLSIFQINLESIQQKMNIKELILNSFNRELIRQSKDIVLENMCHESFRKLPLARQS